MVFTAKFIEAFFLCAFFCLDTKEPKDQQCRIASGRHIALRALVVTFIDYYLLVVHWWAICYAEFIEASSPKQPNFMLVKEVWYFDEDFSLQSK